MRKWLALCLSAVLILSLFACGETEQTPGSTTTAKPTAPTSPTTPAVDPLAPAKAAIDAGEYEKAYDLLLAMDSAEAAELRNKFVFLPVSYQWYSDSDIEAFYTNNHTITYTYDNKGNKLTAEKVYEYEGSESDPNYNNITTYTYDNAGNMLTALTSYKDGSWRKHTYTYDQNSNLLTEVYESDECIYEEFTYTYDNNGNVLSHIEKYHNSPTYVVTISRIYAYDDQGKLTFNQTIQNHGLSESIHETTYNYDENGNLLIEEYSDGQTVTGKCVYTYDENSNLISKVGNDSSYYTYDDRGNVITKEQYENEELKEKVTYTYDDKNRLVTATGPIEIFPVVTITQFYDSAGHIIKRTWTTPEGFSADESVITYDEYGNRLHVYFADDDGENTKYTWKLFYMPDGIGNETQKTLNELSKELNFLIP